jgi:Uma2 family endonuclease
MGMPAPHVEWTAGMARALPDDGQRYEVLDGDLFVTPAPAALHQRAVGMLFERLAPYARQYGLGEVFLSPADIEFGPRRLVQPDIFAVPPLASGRVRSWSDVSELLLVVEVLSPATAHADRHRKRLVYQSQRVPEYWIIDLDARLVECWRPADARPEILTEWLIWEPRAGLEPLSIDLRELFSRILD